jgi:hypothetical protein
MKCPVRSPGHPLLQKSWTPTFAEVLDTHFCRSPGHPLLCFNVRFLIGCPGLSGLMFSMPYLGCPQSFSHRVQSISTDQKFRISLPTGAGRRAWKYFGSPRLSGQQNPPQGIEGRPLWRQTGDSDRAVLKNRPSHQIGALLRRNRREIVDPHVC